MKNMTVEELRKKKDSMTKEELKVISLQKKKNGSATSAALMAQNILWHEDGQGFMSSAHWKRDHTVKQQF